MHKENLKKDIISKIQDLKDERILNDLMQILSFESEETFQLNEDQEKAVYEGLKDLEEGRTYSHLEVKEDFEKWLKK